MVFKRRDKRSTWKVLADFLWPRRGWARAFHYVKHRLHRLPDPPHRIARGIFAGIFVTFSPFFGMHFLLAVAVAWILRGNIVAALLSTFVGNPLTFLPIAVSSLQTGYFLLGRGNAAGSEVHRSLGGKFVDAGRTFWDNFYALFTSAEADWSKLAVFFDEVFLPYMVGGIVPGLICGLAGYYISLPIIQAYKHRRKGRLKAKLAGLKEKAAGKADAKSKQDYPDP